MARNVGIEPTLRGLESLVLPLYEFHRVLGIIPFLALAFDGRRIDSRIFWGTAQ